MVTPQWLTRKPYTLMVTPQWLTRKPYTLMVNLVSPSPCAQALSQGIASSPHLPRLVCIPYLAYTCSEPTLF